MSNTDYTALEALAKAATPGPWWIDSHGHSMVSMTAGRKTIFTTNSEAMGPAVRHADTGNLSHWRNDNDASYIAAASPDVVLGLIEALRVAQSTLMQNTAYTLTLQNDALVLQAELEAAKAETKRYADSVAELELAAHQDGLLRVRYGRERDALQANLRNATNILQSVLNGRTSPMLAQDVVNALNAALDAAVGSAPQQEQKGRYQFTCANGCGVCGVKLAEFEYERTETLDGDFVSNKVAPKLVSACCGNDVDVYDTVADTHTGYTAETVAASVAPHQERKLSDLTPVTQERIQAWIADGTFVDRAIGVMYEQEAEIKRLAQPVAQPAGIPTEELRLMEEIAKLQAKNQMLLEALKHVRNILPNEKFADDTKRLVDAAIAEVEGPAK